ncbi:MAG: hypothetical protein VB065_03090 [Eubacteriales bacterium]|nr:hypothetical protein [Eubacteriales bacterium]
MPCKRSISITVSTGWTTSTRLRAVRALAQITELKRFTNPQYCNWWTHTAAEFARGDVAMAILYYNFASGMLSHASRVADSIGCALPPGGNPVIGGRAQNPQQAMDSAQKLFDEQFAPHVEALKKLR